MVANLHTQIVSIACGSRHSLALNKWGEVFAWGSDHEGQLGLNIQNEPQTTPKCVKSLSSYNIVQIAAGERHSVALSNGRYKFFFKKVV